MWQEPGAWVWHFLSAGCWPEEKLLVPAWPPPESEQEKLMETLFHVNFHACRPGSLVLCVECAALC